MATLSIIFLTVLHLLHSIYLGYFRAFFPSLHSPCFHLFPPPRHIHPFLRQFQLPCPSEL